MGWQFTSVSSLLVTQRKGMLWSDRYSEERGRVMCPTLDVYFSLLTYIQVRLLKEKLSKVEQVKCGFMCILMMFM